KWHRLSHAATEQRVADGFRLLGLSSNAILIKGWSISRFYDPGHYRISTDIDLLFAPVDESGISDEIKDPPPSISIDAHFGPRHLDTLTFQDLLDRSYIVELNGVPIRVLADEDNLRVSAVHWLIDGGVYREKLWDIYYLVKNRSEGFDWARCLESNGPIRKTWVLAAIATARDYLDLDLTGIPEEARDFVLPAWYAQTLEREWKLGVYTRYPLLDLLTRPKMLLDQLKRKFPPNRIAATIDSETPIENTSRIPAQMKSLTKKASSFARGLAGRITYSIRGKRQ
ncbi:MAG TPA: hypothetical protein PLK77_11020, partial [Pyrinomonadaceae bacterium]|nr:hypothetical protein [Pyrinomonadaceae bacterium]